MQCGIVGARHCVTFSVSTHMHKNSAAMPGSVLLRCIFPRQYLPVVNIRALDSVERSVIRESLQFRPFARHETRSPQTGVERSIADDVWPRVYKFLAPFGVAAYTYSRFHPLWRRFIG